MKEQFSAIHVLNKHLNQNPDQGHASKATNLHDKAESIGSLEGVLEFDEEWMSRGSQNSILSQGVSHFVLGDDHFLLEHFNGVQQLRALQAINHTIKENTISDLHLKAMTVVN